MKLRRYGRQSRGINRPFVLVDPKDDGLKINPLKIGKNQREGQREDRIASSARKHRERYVIPIMTIKIG